MKTAIAAAGFALIATLSGLPNAQAAGFNDRGATPDAVASSQAGRQSLNDIPVVHGFNQRSHHAEAVRNPGAGPERASLAVGANYGLSPRYGFNESTSFASC